MLFGFVPMAHASRIVLEESVVLQTGCSPQGWGFSTDEDDMRCSLHVDVLSCNVVDWDRLEWRVYKSDDVDTCVAYAAAWSPQNDEMNTADGHLEYSEGRLLVYDDEGIPEGTNDIKFVLTEKGNHVFVLKDPISWDSAPIEVELKLELSINAPPVVAMFVIVISPVAALVAFEIARRRKMAVLNAST